MKLGGSRQDGGLLRAAVAVLAVVGIAFGASWLATQRTRTMLYQPVRASRVELDLGSGGVDIVGGRSPGVRIQRIDRFAFGHAALERRSLAGGVLRVFSRCPRIIVGSCSSSYRLVVPDDVSVVVHTTAGDIHLDAFGGRAQIQSRSGDVSVDAYCGFGPLAAASGSGDVKVVSACAPETLDLRAGSGNVTAVVPPGRYRVAARTERGRRRVRGIVASSQAVYSIAAQSRTGDVTVAGGL